MLVRLAQGMTHMGKGTMTLNPFHSDRQLMCPAAVAGLLTICYAFLEANNCKFSLLDYEKRRSELYLKCLKFCTNASKHTIILLTLGLHS